MDCGTAMNYAAVSSYFIAALDSTQWRIQLEPTPAAQKQTLEAFGGQLFVKTDCQLFRGRERGLYVQRLNMTENLNVYAEYF